MKKEYITTGRKQQKLNTRTKVLAAARELIEKQVEFTLEDIAEKAGLSRATVYRYYSKVDVLSAEAVLDMNTKSSDTIYEELQSDSILNQLLEVQNYYNSLSADNEAAFRKYLGVVLSNPSEKMHSRAGRRVDTIKKIINAFYPNLSQEKTEKLISALSLFMGIEALIVTKDVCGLTNIKSTAALQWGLEMMVKGFLEDIKNQ